MTHYQNQCKQNETLQRKYSKLIEKLGDTAQLGVTADLSYGEELKQDLEQAKMA